MADLSQIYINYDFPNTPAPAANSVQIFQPDGSSGWSDGGGFVSGFIVMFNSITAPNGWHICDGTNGTPDLRNRFVVSQGGSFPFGTTGGSATQTLAANNLPPHSHVTFGNHTTVGNGGGAVDSVLLAGATGTGNGLTDNGPGTSTAFSIIPPYYALTYIMKL